MTMGLREEESKPPTPEEMVIVHRLLQKAVELRETEGSAALSNFRLMRDSEMKSSMVVYSEQRNM